MRAEAWRPLGATEIIWGKRCSVLESRRKTRRQKKEVRGWMHFEIGDDRITGGSDMVQKEEALKNDSRAVGLACLLLRGRKLQKFNGSWIK